MKEKKKEHLYLLSKFPNVEGNSLRTAYIWKPYRNLAYVSSIVSVLSLKFIVDFFCDVGTLDFISQISVCLE